MINAYQLSDLISRDTLNTMSGKQKEAYKYAICGLFINIIQGTHFTEVQKINLIFLEAIRNCPRDNPDLDGFLSLASTNVNMSLEKCNFKKPYDSKFLDYSINFLRTKVKEISDNGISLFQVSEISKILDVNKFFEISCLADHHWIEFSLDRHLIPTFPEYILFNDLKVQWNNYIDVKEKISESKSKVRSAEDKHNYLKDEDNRSNSYSSGTFYRTLIILCVSFVEAYIYDIFLSIKEGNLPNKQQIESILNERKLQDIEIINRVIFHLFPELKNDSEFMVLFTNYKKIVKIRDRYIHASAFINESSNKSDLEPLLNLKEDILVDALQDSVDFVKKMNELLPDELKLLYWMDHDKSDEKYNKSVNFHNLSKLSLTNSTSCFNRRNYHNL